MNGQRPVALVTGASVGIGHAICRRFAAAGYDVAGGSRSADRLASVRGAVEDAAGAFLPVIGDIREHTTAEQGVAAVLERFGRLDVLVNNAAGGFYWRLRATHPGRLVRHRQHHALRHVVVRPGGGQGDARATGGRRHREPRLGERPAA